MFGLRTEIDSYVAAQHIYGQCRVAKKILEAVENTPDVASEEAARRLPAGVFEDLVVQPGSFEQDFDEPVVEPGGVGVSRVEVDADPSPAVGPEVSATLVGQDLVVTGRTVEWGRVLLARSTA